MELLSYLLRNIKLNSAECDAIGRAFSKQIFAKGTVLAHPDNHHQNVYFIEKGLLRAFYNLDGKDITHYFFDENNFLISFESFFLTAPTPMVNRYWKKLVCVLSPIANSTISVIASLLLRTSGCRYRCK